MFRWLTILLAALCGVASADVPRQPESAGSTTSDGTRSFAYDAENQLVTSWVAGAWKSVFVYDGLGRRRMQRDYGWQTNAWVKTNEIRLVYDGMLPIQERDGNNVPQGTYTRGLDLSGTLQYAGGIGGLLARTDGNGSTYYHADGAGNITGLMDANENMAARYMYGAFGKLTAQWGSLASANVMQFSSVPRHANSGLSLYTFRAYDAALQRWTSHDPISEAGGINLYSFAGNNPVSNVDPLGLAPGDWWDPRTYSPGYAKLQGQLALQAQLKAAGYGSIKEYQLDDPGYGGTLTSGNLDAVQAAAATAGESANLYVIAATAVTPTGAGTRCAVRLTQQGLEHIARRHLFGTGAKNAGKFAEGLGARGIRDMIDQAVANSVASPSRFGRNVFDYNFGQVIGTDIAGNPATSLRVVVEPDGNVVTAFPK